MGNLQLYGNQQKQIYPLDIYRGQKEHKILQWRSNPTLNQFIPKVFLEYQQEQDHQSFLNNCKTNQNLPVSVSFESFIGNLNLFKGKLCFQQSLYVLKSLLTGYQTILLYFGKAVVHLNFCFVTKEGEVKAWINSDYRKNIFENSNGQHKSSVTEDQKLFLSPDQWIDQTKQTSSVGNIIQSILNMVSDLAYEQKQYNSFIKKVNLFVLENILKNYDIDRILKFTNKFIYQKKLFVKSNLLDAIQRIYEANNVNQTQNIRKSTGSSIDERVTYSSPENSNRKQNIQPQFQTIIDDDVKLRKCVSGRQSSGRSFTYNGPQFVKKSTFFESTLNSNGKEKLSTLAGSNIDNLKDHISSSKCSIHQQGGYYQLQKKLSQRKNHISPQYSFNHFTQTNSLIKSSKKMISVLSTPKSSSISSQNSMTNKNNICLNNESSLKMITQRKQTQNEEQKPQQNKSINRLSHHSSIKKSVSIAKDQNLSSKIQNQVRFSHMIEENKRSNVSILHSLNNNYSFAPSNHPRTFNSNYLDQNYHNNNRQNSFISPNKKSVFHKNSVMQNTQQNFNNFTMKTITKLISSNGEISDQQVSQGDFPSKQNISSYSGILASMGRSAQIVEVPSDKRISFRNDKKLKTMIISSYDSPNKNTFKSVNMFESH